MTLIERINALITSIGADIKSLMTNKVNKTDIIPVPNGGTGAVTQEEARSNLGFGNATINNRNFDVVGNNLVSRYTNFLGVPAGTTYNATLADSEAFIQVGDNTTVTLPSTGLTARTSFTVIHAGTGADSYINVTGSQFIYYPPTGLFTTAKTLTLKAGETVEIFFRGGNEFDVIAGSYIVRTLLQNITTNSIKSGSTSYKKGWRKLTTTLPNQAGEISIAHGVTTIETVQAKVTSSDGLIIFNNDIDPANQFYVRVDGANIVLGVTANSSKVFGKPVTIYVGEEL